MARTSTTTEARRVARARLAEKTAARRKRELAELERIVDFEAASARRAHAETEMAAAVAALLELGNSVAAAAELTAQPESEIRRLRRLATETGPSAPRGEDDPDDGDIDGQDGDGQAADDASAGVPDAENVGTVPAADLAPALPAPRRGDVVDGQDELSFDLTDPAQNRL